MGENSSNLSNDDYNETNINWKYEESLAADNKIQKKEMGKYYTPIDVAHLMAKLALDLDPFPTNICDVCCGTGNLIIELLNSMPKERAISLLKEGRIWLYDIDNTALKICCAILRNRYGDVADNIHVNCGDFLSQDSSLPEDSLIISNPPYAYNRSTRTDLYVQFFEKFIDSKNKVVIITPHSFMGVDSYSSFRNKLKEASGYIFSWDNVPGNIFNGKKFGIFNSNTANSTRAAITVVTDYTGEWKISPYIRFKSNEREAVLNNEFLMNSLFNYEYDFSSIYRLDHFFDESVWLNNNTLSSILSSKPTNFKLDVSDSCRYYLTATPRTLKRTGKITLYFKNELDLYTAYANLNSSLGYYWQRINNGGISYPTSLIKKLPIFEIDAETVEYCKSIFETEEDYIVYKKNAGKLQENIKLPLKVRDELNKRLLKNNYNANLLRCHCNSIFSDIPDDNEKE